MDAISPSAIELKNVARRFVTPTGEVLSALVVAVHAAVPVSQLRHMIYAYPTFHRAIQSALTDLS